jgi:hypothetical protein
MDETRNTYVKGDLETLLLPQLMNEVFHVAKIESYESILAKNYIDSNSEGSYPRNWGNDCYGRQRGFVCLFDLRDLQSEVITEYLPRCDFLYDKRFGSTSAYLLLAKSSYENIIPNRVAVDETACREFFIPWLEAWYPGRLPLERIERVLLVNKLANKINTADRAPAVRSG